MAKRGYVSQLVEKNYTCHLPMKTNAYSAFPNHAKQSPAPPLNVWYGSVCCWILLDTTDSCCQEVKKTLYGSWNISLHRNAQCKPLRIGHILTIAPKIPMALSCTWLPRSSVPHVKLWLSSCCGYLLDILVIGHIMRMVGIVVPFFLVRVFAQGSWASSPL